MSDALYHDAIKSLARNAHGSGRLAVADTTVRLDNPLCGDRITLDVGITNGRITAIGHETKGCLLCLAAASLIGKHVPGTTLSEALGACQEIRTLLTEPTSRQPWPGMEAFAPVAAYPSRHGCVLLPFRALASALASPPPSQNCVTDQST
jgi:nitrogen fixation NifU-like protein